MRTQNANAAIIKNMAKGLGVASGVTLVSILAMALVVSKLSTMSDSAIIGINQAVKLLSILAGTFAMLGKKGEKGLVKGLALGGSYMLVGLAAFLAMGGSMPSIATLLADIAMGAAMGGISGIIATNLRKR